MKHLSFALVLTLIACQLAEARVVRLRVERREVVLDGRSFGLAGPYEKLSGTAEFALDPDLPQNRRIVDLALAPRNGNGEVEFSADFYLLKPVDPARGNGRLFYEAGNRGSKRILPVFQKAASSSDPTTEAEYGNGALMRQGFSLLWLGWQWDVPEGRMRMEMPIATQNGEPITGLVRGNFIPGAGWTTAPLADRNHRAYPVLDPGSDEHVMTVRRYRVDPPRVVPRNTWRFVDEQTVTLDGGFEPGMIYDVVYRTRDPRVIGCGLAGTRDVISYFKYGSGDDHPLPGIRHAIGWGVSQTGRFLRHLVYQGFNEDESGRRVFDGIFDQVGGAGRGSFNHRFGQASRDALHHFNILYPVDMFPFSDASQTDPETGDTDGLLALAEQSGTVPKMFHLLTNSEYFNRAGSLVHTDPTGSRDAEIPETSRIYFIASAPHGGGPFPPVNNEASDQRGQGLLNPLDYSPVVRALFRALDGWVSRDVAPPPSQYPRIADGTLTAPERAGWPAIPNLSMPLDPMPAYRLDFGPDWGRGIVSNEPPAIGKPFTVLVPAVDQDGNDRAGIRLPEIAVPLATQKGWNFRHPGVGAPDRLAGEVGGYYPFPRTAGERQRTGDPRRSIEERYASKHEYLGGIAEASVDLVTRRYLLPEDVADVISRAAEHYEWAVGSAASSSAP